MNKKDIKNFLIKHRFWFRLAIGTLLCIIAMVFFLGAILIFGQMEGGAEIMAGVIMVSIAGFFFKASTGMQDNAWEEILSPKENEL